MVVERSLGEGIGHLDRAEPEDSLLACLGDRVACMAGPGDIGAAEDSRMLEEAFTIDIHSHLAHLLVEA